MLVFLAGVARAALPKYAPSMPLLSYSARNGRQ
jgi:hypothetical protein